MDPDSSSEEEHSARQPQSRRRGPEKDWDHSRNGKQVRPRQLESANQRPAAQALFANSHHNSFIRSTINVAGGDQTNTFVEDSEAGLKLLYQAIAHVGAFHDSETRYPPPKCHPKTRKAVLSDISSWIRGAWAGTRVRCRAGARRGAEAETPVHWLYGPAGAGKSAIAQTLAESFACTEEGNHLAASFFFSRSDPSRNNPKFLIMVISCCLAVWCGNSQLRAAIDSAVKTRPTILKSAIEKQFQQLVIEPFKAIPKESWETLPRVVIIDGLDECLGSDSQRRVLNTLFGGLRDQTPLRFLIASRPEPVIRDFFGQHCGVTTRTELSDNYSASWDIKVYLRDGFKAIAEKSHSDVMAHITLPWPPIGVIHELVQRASGQFIYASTVLKYVGEEYSLPVERLELVLGLPLGDPDAFSELDVLYRQILLSNRNKARVIQILGTILVIEDIRSVRRPGEELELVNWWNFIDDRKCFDSCGMIEWYLQGWSHDTSDYVSRSIPGFQKYAKVLESHQIKTLSDSLQLGIYVTDTDGEELSKKFLSELEFLFALAMDCHYAPLNAIFPHNAPSSVDILASLGYTISFLSMKKIFLCLDPRLHSHSHSTASRNPIWHFIDFERGYGRLAKHCLKAIRGNPCIEHRGYMGPPSNLECGYIYAQSRMSELLHHSPLDVELQHELKKTIPYLNGTKELHKVLLWLQGFPDDQRDIPMELAIQQHSERSHFVMQTQPSTPDFWDLLLEYDVSQGGPRIADRYTPGVSRSGH
ncbi:hypothetical protein D9758_015019 [Tetrapyrgos nigripes]|uniref:NACHT domain-containing protein n=1 Tax=Tetrapyrgos nigripes TaxID=182062 RepID=A0A8H5FK97_9AGAR|nr:hypothetical protein D9758_015019 [Tetrapyrgos nigripes]